MSAYRCVSVQKLSELQRCLPLQGVHWRSENPPFNMQNSPANVWWPMTSFYSDVEPLLKHSPVALHLSPATRILKENTASWRSMPNTGTQEKRCLSRKCTNAQ